MTYGGAQGKILEDHYSRASGAIALLDETYSVDSKLGKTFYLMSAVVVEMADMDVLREELDDLVPDGYWHTVEALKTAEGEDMALELLDALASGQEKCIISHVASVSAGDVNGEVARRASLEALFGHLAKVQTVNDESVSLAVLEQRREMKQRQADRATRASAINKGLCSTNLSLAQISPSSEHLLWLPDLVCSAYRRSLVKNDRTLYEPIEAMTTVYTS